MNIVIVNDYAYNNGGASQVAISTAVALAHKGHFVTFFTAVGPIDEALLSKNISVICLEQKDILDNSNRFHAAITGIWNVQAKKKFELLLCSMDVTNTIIHVHSYSKALSSSVFKVALTKKFKVVTHLHDYGIICPNMGFYNYSTQSICHKKPLTFSCLVCNCDSRTYIHKLWRYFRQLVQIHLAGIPLGIEYFVGISSYSYELLKPFLPLTSRIYIISNPIDIIQSLIVKSEISSMYIAIGRIEREKGPELLAEVGKELNIPILYVGDGSYVQEVNQIYPSAEVTGWVDRKDVQKYLLNARALIFPSRCHETQGLVVAEALACGVPVVVPDTCAAREMVEDNINGLIFESGNQVDLARKIQILQDDEMVKKMAEVAYRRYWDNPMTLEKYANEVERLYNQIFYE